MSKYYPSILCFLASSELGDPTSFSHEIVHRRTDSDIQGFSKEETSVIDDEELPECDWSARFCGVEENRSIVVSERVHVFLSYSMNASGSKNLRYVSNLTLSSLRVFALLYLGENQVSSLFYQWFGSIGGVLEEHCWYFLPVWSFRCLIVFGLFRLYFFWYILLSDLLCVLVCKQYMANEDWAKIKLNKWFWKFFFKKSRGLYYRYKWRCYQRHGATSSKGKSQL